MASVSGNVPARGPEESGAVKPLLPRKGRMGDTGRTVTSKPTTPSQAKTAANLAGAVATPFAAAGAAKSGRRAPPPLPPRADAAAPAQAAPASPRPTRPVPPPPAPHAEGAEAPAVRKSVPKPPQAPKMITKEQAKILASAFTVVGSGNERRIVHVRDRTFGEAVKSLFQNRVNALMEFSRVNHLNDKEMTDTHNLIGHVQAQLKAVPNGTGALVVLENTASEAVRRAAIKALPHAQKLQLFLLACNHKNPAVVGSAMHALSQKEVKEALLQQTGPNVPLVKMLKQPANEAETQIQTHIQKKCGDQFAEILQEAGRSIMDRALDEQLTKMEKIQRPAPFSWEAPFEKAMGSPKEVREAWSENLKQAGEAVKNAKEIQALRARLEAEAAAAGGSLPEFADLSLIAFKAMTDAEMAVRSLPESIALAKEMVTKAYEQAKNSAKSASEAVEKKFLDEANEAAQAARDAAVTAQLVLRAATSNLSKATEQLQRALRLADSSNALEPHQRKMIRETFRGVDIRPHHEALPEIEEMAKLARREAIDATKAVDLAVAQRDQRDPWDAIQIVDIAINNALNKKQPPKNPQQS